MNSRQRVIFQGNVGKDPDIRYTPSGVAVANFSVATENSYKDRNGEWQKDTEWLRCVAFGNLAERIGENVRKGTGVSSDDARMKTRSWEDKNGVTRYTTEVIVNKLDFLTNFGNNQQGGGGQQYPPQQQQQRPPQQQRQQAPAENHFANPDDDIPF